MRTWWFRSMAAEWKWPLPAEDTLTPITGLEQPWPSDRFYCTFGTGKHRSLSLLVSSGSDDEGSPLWLENPKLKKERSTSKNGFWKINLRFQSVTSQISLCPCKWDNHIPKVVFAPFVESSIFPTHLNF